jgi:hypothetical protein
MNGSVEWASYYGGPQQDEIYDIKVDKKTNDIYACGKTQSISLPLLATQLSPPDTVPFSNDGFILKLSPSLNIVWATYTGVSPIVEIEIDNNSNVYFVGSSTSANILASQQWSGTNYYIGAPNNTGHFNAFILACDNTTQLKWFTPLSGNNNTFGRAIAFTPNKFRLYIGGDSDCTNDFPWKNKGHWYESTNKGGRDLFIAKFVMDYNLVANYNVQKEISFKTTLFPTVSNGLFNLSIQSEKVNEYSLTVYSILGRVLCSKKLPKSANHQELLDLSSYSSGTYFIRINKGSEVFTHKAILIK